MAAPLPEGVLDVHGVAELLGCGLRDAYAWMHAAPGITWKARQRLLVTRQNVLAWRDGDPEVRRRALIDPNPKPQQQQGRHLRMA